jgi:hypothetical protein
MCTLTWRPADGSGYDLFFNRDELETRVEEVPPSPVTGLLGMAAPRDGVGGGTWLALNDRGVVLALLNHYPESVPTSASPARGRPSRGTICWQVENARSAAEALDRVTAGHRLETAPFHVVALDAEGGGAWRSWDGERWSGGPAPRFLTSSSYRTREIEAERTERWRRVQPSSPAAMETFHWSHDPAFSAASICMSRSDARTRSVSHVIVRPDRRRLSYWPVLSPGVKTATPVDVLL